MGRGRISNHDMQYCRNGCGYTYKRKPFNKRIRDRFDYHQRSGCSLLPTLRCLLCATPDKPMEFRGLFRFQKHCKGTKHRLLQKLAQKETISTDELLAMMVKVACKVPFRRGAPLAVPTETNTRPTADIRTPFSDKIAEKKSEEKVSGDQHVKGTKREVECYSFIFQE